MSLPYRSYLMAALAAVCVLLCTSASLRAEEDDGEDAAIVVLTDAQRSQAQALNSQPVQTVPLSRQGIAPAEYNGDVRDLPPVLVPRYFHSWNDFAEPVFVKPAPPQGPTSSQPLAPLVQSAPMPSTVQSFPGLSFGTAVTGGQAGAGWPPDVNGDVGPVYYIQAVNDAWGIFNKSTGANVAAFTEDQLWTSATTGTPCDASNFGDPVAIHDGPADRWVLTDFAFDTNPVTGDPVAPFYQCFAVSKTSDPVAGGWYLYAVQMDIGGTGAPPAHTFTDYPKFGFWSDCLYMGANGFDNDTGNYAGSVFAAFDRTAMFSGATLDGTNSSVGFIPSDTSFGLFPANLQGIGAGSQPPAGTAEYFVAESGTGFAFDVRKFQKGTTACGAGSTLSGITSVAQTAYGMPRTGNTLNSTSNIVPQPGVARKLDSLDDELMQRVVYRKIGNTESLWVVHTTCGTGQSAAGFCVSNTTPTQPQWAQIDVSGGTIHTTAAQQQIYNPGGGLYRWMGSVAVDHQGNMAIGYNTSGSTSPNFPSIAYSGRLATDPLNQLPQTEVQLAAGLGSQNTCGAFCGGQGVSRWGDYSAMVIDPADDCTFWYTSMFYRAASHTTGAQWDTQIGSFTFPGCAVYNVTATVSGGHGTVAATSQIVNGGNTASVVVTPNAGYHVASVTGDTCTLTQQGATTTWNTSGISNDCAVTATFAINTYTVTASVNGANGTITPPSQSVNFGSAATFTITPAAAFLVKPATGDTCTVSNTSGTTWTSSSISANCAVSVTFATSTLVFTQQPTNLVRGSQLGTIEVTEKDASNNTVDDNATVDFTIAACNGTIDLGSVQMVHGVATLSSTQLFYTIASGLHVNASASASLTGTSQNFAVLADPDELFADGFDGCRL